MMHKAWCSMEEVLYCFSRSYINFQSPTGQKIANFDPNWVFPDGNSSLKMPMALKCCTKLNVVWKRCPIIFQGYPSNVKVMRDKKSPTFYPNWAFRDNNSSLNSPMHLKWCTKFHLVQKRCLIVFRGHSSNFKVCLIDDFYPIWVRLLGQSQLSNPSDLPCDGIAWKSGKLP